MKKHLLTFFLIVTITATFGQTINFGIKAGLNLSELSYTNPSFTGGSFLTAFNAGGIVDIGFQGFSIQPGIFFSIKGEKQAFQLVYANDQNQQNLSLNTTLYYIEVPINVFYKIVLAPGMNIHFGGGPYIAYGISESAPQNLETNSPGVSGQQSFAFKNPDYGLNFIAGLTLNNVILDAGYGLGLANLSKGSSTIHNRVISISVGYLFK